MTKEMESGLRQKIDKEKQDKINRYATIQLNFGKYKGQTLGAIKTVDENYLKWLLTTYESEHTAKTPTQIAIMNYIKNTI